MCENEEKEVMKNFASELEKIDNKIKEDLQKDLKSLDLCLLTIAKKINELYIKRKERLIATKGRFNLFTTLLAIGNETRLHSRFITHLLNPEGNHDCGNLFLNLFIDTISESNLFSDDAKKKAFDDIKNQKCDSARTEQPADGRRIDIYLKFNKSIIAIENKIWAGEQPNQIFDYGKFIKSNKKKNFLFYLTLDGKDSETAEIIDENSEKRNVKYFPISYKEHIFNWLEKCLQATYKYININQAIQQYQNVIKQLTNQTMENEEMEEIKEIIMKNPIILKYADEISRSAKEIKYDVINNFFNELERILKSNEFKIECIWGNRKDLFKPNIGLKIKAPEINSFFDNRNDQSGIIIQYCPNEDNFFIGLFLDKNSMFEKLPKDDSLKEKLKEIMEKNYDHNISWFAYKQLIEKGKSFKNADFIYKMLDSNNLNEEVKRTYGLIIDFVNDFLN